MGLSTLDVGRRPGTHEAARCVQFIPVGRSPVKDGGGSLALDTGWVILVWSEKGW